MKLALRAARTVSRGAALGILGALVACTGAAGDPGSDGSAGTSTLVLTTPEPAGANCAFGGARIDTGVDANHDGILEPGEIDPAGTTYVCALGPDGAISPSTGLVAAVKPGGVSTAATAPITVRFTLRDDRGFPIDVAGVYSVNTPIQPRFAIGYFTQDAATGVASPLTVYTQATSAAAPAGQPTSFNPLGTAPGNGTLVENGYGAGDYTYTFPTTSIANGPQAVAYDVTKRGESHVVWIQASRQTDEVFAVDANTFYAANTPYYFVPDASRAPVAREIVAQSGCDSCHARFAVETTTTAAFHGGGRVAVGMCNVCHNPGRTTNPAASSASFIHRIHNGENVATENLFHGIAATYPRDIRDCATCHANAAQGAQAQTNPSKLACAGCHDYVSFTGAAPATCQILGQLVRGPDGKPVTCNHVAGPQPDTSCVTCHGPSGGFAAARYHIPVVAPDPGNAWLVPGGNVNTNASFLAAGGYVPADAEVITYDLASVDAVLDATVTPPVKRPQITFKLLKNGADVVFSTYAPAATPPVTELIPNFVGAPSAYFAFAVPQDGNPTPADFNASASGYLKTIWAGTATGAGAGTLTGPDASGYYKLTLTGVQIPALATLVTGGIGYTYSLASSPPLVQTNVPAYPWTPAGDGTAQGGLSVPAPDLWKVATGYAGRRAIVDNAKCKNCHGALGVAPTFHAGQRNDGPTCSFCHNPNRTSSGWAAGSKYFIHAIHAGRKRTVPYTWHAEAADASFGDVEFPGTLNACTTCHIANTYDFTSPANLAAVPAMELTTVATGKLDANPLTNSTFYTLSPYVVADGVTSYGAGFAYNAATNVTTEAAGTTLVMSPITGACAACHDAPAAINHMKSAGGQFYATRAAVLAQGPGQEQCLLCHGPGKLAAIGVVHAH